MENLWSTTGPFSINDGIYFKNRQKINGLGLEMEIAGPQLLSSPRAILLPKWKMDRPTESVSSPFSIFAK